VCKLEKTGFFMLDWQKCRLKKPWGVSGLRARIGLYWRCTALLLVAAFIGAGLASWPTKTRATEPAPPSLNVTDPRLQRDLAGHWVLKGGVSVSLSPALIAAIERGVSLEFESIFRARQTRWGFVKRLVYEEKRVARLQFQPLTRLFYVFKGDSPVAAFDDLTKALRACLVVTDWRVASSEQVFEGLELSLRLRLDENALPKPLLIGALTTADYQLATGWLRVDYRHEPLPP
jgi:hypothetical protein